jgi:hypothetical protein
VLGMLLMATPLIFDTEAPLYYSDHVAGCLVIMVAVTAMAEVVRPVRFLNLPIGAWVAASPFLLDGGSGFALAANVTIGLALVALSLPRGTRSNEHYGGWDRAIIWFPEGARGGRPRPWRRSDAIRMNDWPIGINVAVFACSAAIVWIAGTRMVHLVDRLAGRTGMGHGFAGMMLLGGVVSLTEISTVTSAAFTGSPLLALNNLLGSESINLFLLAAVDPLMGREALTSFIAKPAMLLQGTLTIALLAFVAVGMVTGDTLLLGVGMWSAILFVLCLGALWMSARYEGRRVWIASAAPQPAGAP